VSKDYGYARFWAGALTVLGTLFVLLGFLVAVAATAASRNTYRTRILRGE